MKKFLSILLCLVLVSGMLVSCDDDRIFGSYLPNYDGYTPEVKEKLTLNLYIITDEETDENAKDTVALNINLYTTRVYNTELKVHYFTAAEYQSGVNAAINSSDKDSANIVLINSDSMMTELVSAGKLADLTEYLKTDEYGMLNVNIASALLESAKINGKFYAIPNNHIVGEYEYTVIKKWANDEFNVIPPSMFENDLGPVELEGIDALIDELSQKLEDNGYNPDDYIYTTTDYYEYQDSIEQSGDVECIVTKNPTANASVAFSSAFAIINRGEKLNERAMKMIYAINMDNDLRDLLQYGVADINYKLVDGDVVSIKNPTTTYVMNPLHTGNVFSLSYSSEIGWTKTASENGKLQNKEAVAG